MFAFCAARQIALLEHGAFSCIGSEEFQSQRWNKQPQFSPNLRHLIHDFNRMSMWVAYMIVREFDLKTRVIVMAYMIDVGYQSYKVCCWCCC